MQQTWTALDAVTVTGAGSPITFKFVARTISMQSVVTGTPSAVSLTLQGSIDGTNWVTLATSTSTTGDLQASVDKPVKHIRANLGTLTGGTTPTVTALVAVGQ